MDDLKFSPHARDEMADDQIPETAVYHIVSDADEEFEQDNGRTAYTGVWEDRAITAVVEDDGRTVVTVWEWKRESRRRRRRRR